MIFYIIYSNLFYYFFIKNSKKYFLCRPRGGLNDTLNQIELSCRYCIKYKRKLFVDTYKSGLLDDLSNYFIFPKYISFDKINFIEYPASVYPDDLQYDIYNYEIIYSNDGIPLYNGHSLKINFDKNYHEQYIVHDSGGGGRDYIDLLYKTKLKKYLKQIILTNKKFLGKYAAVHIRNTDLKTDYMDFLININKELIYNKIVVCTDSYEVLQFSKNLFKDKLYIFSNIPNTHGASLHANEALDSKIVNNYTLIDLFMLALSNKLYTTKVTGNIYSGYSRLAMFLHENKFLLYKLLYF